MRRCSRRWATLNSFFIYHLLLRTHSLCRSTPICGRVDWILVCARSPIGTESVEGKYSFRKNCDEVKKMTTTAAAISFRGKIKWSECLSERRTASLKCKKSRVARGTTTHTWCAGEIKKERKKQKIQNFLAWYSASHAPIAHTTTSSEPFLFFNLFTVVCVCVWVLSPEFTHPSS